MDVTRRPADKWIVDFGWRMSEDEAVLYEEPFRWVKERVYEIRQQNRVEANRVYWYRHRRPVPDLWAALANVSRYIATVRHTRSTACSAGSTRVSAPTQP